MKTTYELYLEANARLFKCFESVSEDQYKALSHQEQEQLCHSERQEVSTFLSNDSLRFGNLLQERLNLVKPHQ